MTRILRRIGLGIGVFVSIWFLVALGLVVTPIPTFSWPAIPAPAGIGTPPGDPCNGDAIRCFTMNDGTRLAARITGTGDVAMILYLHGVLGSGENLAASAELLSGATGARVIRLDLRGHGLSEGRPGDVDFIGQYDDDVAQVVARLRQEYPAARLVLAGHSMGGGIALRYSANRRKPPVDGYLLLAPLLGSQSPTARQGSPQEEGNPADGIMQVALPRVIGLTMLNMFGITALNGRPTLLFNLSPEWPLRRYSFRAMASMAEENYRAALTADEKPLLVVVGADDEAFEASAYPDVIALHPNGQTVLVPGQNHDGVIVSDGAILAARTWMATVLSIADR